MPFSLFNTMKIVLILVLTCLTCIACSQERNDFIIKLNKDTSFVNIISIDRKMKNVVCEENGKKIKYNAKDILALKLDTSFYESGFVKLKTFSAKQYVFLYKTAFGKLNLFETKVRRAGFTLSALLIWAKDGTAWGKRRWETLFFYKKEYELRESFSRNWKIKTKDCSLLLDKCHSKTSIWKPTPKEIVRFYNMNCK